MAGGRRNAKSSSFNKHQAHASDDRHAELPTQPQVIPPKHIPIPDLPPLSDLQFEFYSFLLCIFAMAGQYINLYRSVFWFSTSNTEYALNYYLIDCYVMIFSLIVIGRRMPVYLLKQICLLCLPASYHSSCILCIHILVAIILAPVLIFCSYNIVIKHGFLSIPFLIYPFVIYFIVHGTKMTKFFELITPYQERQTGARSKHSANSKQTTDFSHVCSMSAETIREEVETLKNDLNCRWKQVLYNSFLFAYYTAFLPCYFTQPELYYDISFAIQLGIFILASSFTLYVTHCFPPKYFDVLHRAALHLGRWQKMENKGCHVPYSVWSENTTWNQGALVKHSKELFKAEGISNAAEPGHSGQSKFYGFFKNPAVPVKVVFIFDLFLLASLLIALSQSSTWHKLIPLQLLIMVNFKPFYTLLKMFTVIRKIYYEEKLLISKYCS